MGRGMMKGAGVAVALALTWTGSLKGQDLARLYCAGAEAVGTLGVTGIKCERCRFVNEGCVAIAPDGRVSPCLPLLHTYSYYFRGDRRHIRPWYVGNINKTSLMDIWNAGEYRAFRGRVRDFVFSPCIDCGSCELRESNEEDCYGNIHPCCGECLWAAGLVQCP